MALWQLVVTVFPIPAFILPGPLAVWRTAAAFGTNWIPHAVATISVALAGFAVAIMVGLLLAVIIVHSRLLAQVLTPALVILQIVPKIAFAPLFLLWFGLGPLPIVVVTFLVSFFPMVVNGTVGLSDIERDLLDLTRVLRLNWWRVLWSIRFPSALPHLFSGLKVASTLAVIGAIIGEFVGSNRGLGYLVLIANNNLNTPLALASIALISLFGLALYAAIVLIEMATVPWKEADLALEEVTQDLTSPASVELHDVAREFVTRTGRVLAVEAMSMRVRECEFVAILGPSGCGKSTLLKMVAGLLPPSRGKVLVDGRPVTEPLERLGMVFQSPVLLRWRTALNNVLFPAEALGQRDEAMRERALGLLKLVGLRALSKNIRMSFPAAWRSASRLPGRCCSIPGFC